MNACWGGNVGKWAETLLLIAFAPIFVFVVGRFGGTGFVVIFVAACVGGLIVRFI